MLESWCIVWLDTGLQSLRDFTFFFFFMNWLKGLRAKVYKWISFRQLTYKLINTTNTIAACQIHPLSLVLAYLIIWVLLSFRFTWTRDKIGSITKIPASNSSDFNDLNCFKPFHWEQFKLNYGFSGHTGWRFWQIFERELFGSITGLCFNETFE